jgi:integrase
MADALGTMFKWLHQHRRIAVNPCIGLHRPAAPAARDRVLNCRADVRQADELRWFWQGCQTLGQPFGTISQLLLLTGCRLKEIACMQWDELSDDLAMLRLPGSRTKNGFPHDVPLSPLAREIITNVGRVPGCKYVFTTNRRTPVSGFSKYKKQLDQAMATVAGKAIAPWRTHDLRRSCATGMNGIRISPHIVEAAINHVSGAKAGVAGTYNRERYEAEKRDALERWARYVSGVTSGRGANFISMNTATS